MEYFFIIPFLFFSMFILYFVASFVKKRIVGFFLLVVSLLWLWVGVYNLSDDKFVLQSIGVYICIISLTLLFKMYKMAYLLWSLGIILFSVLLFINSVYWGVISLLVGLILILYRKKFFLEKG